MVLSFIWYYLFRLYIRSLGDRKRPFLTSEIFKSDTQEDTKLMDTKDPGGVDNI
jgi:hypothetical protein